MIEIIKPVRYGILIGLIGFVLGIGWAFWLILGHERIHESLQRRTVKIEQKAPEKHEDTNQYTKEDRPLQKEKGDIHKENEDHHNMDKKWIVIGAGKEPKQHLEGGHDDPVIKLSHERLTKGHVHVMGLGIVTIVISLVLSFTSATDRIKTIASVLSGIGGIVYPIAWVVMGYRTPALGPDAAEASVTTIAGPGVALVSLGIFTVIAFILKDSFTKK